MRNCKRCKVANPETGSTNCAKCNERNERHTANLIASSANVIKVKNNYPVYGGLGSEWDSGVAGHMDNF